MCNAFLPDESTLKTIKLGTFTLAPALSTLISSLLAIHYVVVSIRHNTLGSERCCGVGQGNIYLSKLPSRDCNDPDL